MPAQVPSGSFAPMGGQGGRRGEVGRPGMRPRRFFRSPSFTGRFTISGVTRNSVGVALGSCEVHLFETATDLLVARTTSDGAGLFSFSLGTNSGTFYIVAYKATGTDVFGTTVNTLPAT